MTESIKSINIVVRIDFRGRDIEQDSIQKAIDNMSYEFSYNDDYIRIINTEIVDTFVSYPF